MAGRTGAGAWLAIAVLALGLTACESSESDASPARGHTKGFTVVMPPAELSAAETASLPPGQRDLPGVAITLRKPWRPVLPPLDVASPVRFSISNRKQRPLCTEHADTTTCDRRTLRRLPPSSVVVSFEWLRTEPKCPKGSPMSACSLTYDGRLDMLANQVAVERRTAPGSGCPIPGADRIVVYRGWSMPPDGHEFAITACIRGPRFHQLDDQAERAMRTVAFLYGDARPLPKVSVRPGPSGNGGTN